MAGGNPFEPYHVAGLKIPRYKMAMYGIFAYAALIIGYKQYSALQPKPPVTFDSPEEEAWVRKYVSFQKAELHKPLLVREKFNEPTGL
ncbi:hypothetical protein HDV00_003556 [Rhizophlyctis rosea]|nr:hypothetical protein HDV00_003556 [Rhizophlyctis rosea]